MKRVTQDQHFLKNEKIQIFFRIVIVSFFIINFMYFYSHNTYESKYTLQEILFLPLVVVFSNIFYIFFLQKYPYLYQQQRILMTMSLDIFATVFVLYMIDGAAVYYPGVLLWFIIGYGTRYGLLVGYISYFLVLISWLILMNYSSFWLMHFAVAEGWLITYLVLPLYYFKLISQLQQTINQLHVDVDKSTFLAKHDTLTQLPNRYLFDIVLTQYIESYKKTQQKFSLFFIDLDKFKEINDIYGHDAGDKVLIEASKRIQKVGDFTARLGGDEFVTIMKYSSKIELEKKARELIQHINNECHNTKISLSASVGISCFPDDTHNAHDLKKYADKAMYEVKQSGKNEYCFYSDNCRSVALELNK